MIPGLPTMIPAGLSKEQEEAYLCKLTYLLLNAFKIVPSYLPDNIFCYGFHSIYPNYSENLL